MDMNKPVAWWDGKHFASKDKSSLADIPLYTQAQLEEARKLGMQQERALWNLSESTQEFEDKPQAEELHEILESNTHPVKELHLSLQKSQDGELLAVTYTDYEHRIVEVLWEKPPVKELNDGGEPVKNATYWKRQYNLMSAQCDNLKSGLYHANEQIKYLESHPAELTNEEILEIGHQFGETELGKDVGILDFARAILRKAQEK